MIEFEKLRNKVVIVELMQSTPYILFIIFSLTGVVSTVAGSSRGFADGVGTNAKFSYPTGIILDTNKNMFVADSGNHRVRKITPQGNEKALLLVMY